MSASEAILKAASSAKVWIGVFIGGMAAVAVAAVPLDGRYAKAAELDKVKDSVAEVREKEAADHAVLTMIREDTKSILEAIRQEQWRAHRFSIPESMPPDMGAPAVAPRGR